MEFHCRRHVIKNPSNIIACGDNLEWLAQVPDESVDLCYIDPPFFSNRNYEVIWGNGYELRAFGDRFAGGVSHYIEWMRPRIELIHKKLKSTGTIYLHCDWHASHRLRCMMDDIFGSNHFINEIVWKRIHTVKGNFGQGRSGLDPNTDSIFIYSKSDSFTFRQPFKEYTKEYLDKFYSEIEPETGRRYQLISMNGPGGAAKGNPFYSVMGVEKFWRYSKKKMDELISQGLVVQKTAGAVPRKKQYLDEGKGVAIQTLWDDITFQNGETLGYPTQKPEQLIRRIIEMSSNEGDVVLDCFAGGGTTAKAAVSLKRRFVVGDVSPVACKII
ncbi:MAG: site-specific DNA-methyltransferase, partial [Proteobacteria bacterium]